MLKYQLGHIRMEEQSLNMNQLLKVYFASALWKKQEQSFLSKMSHFWRVEEWRNNKEFLMRGLLEPVSAIHSYIFVTSIQQCASQS